MLINYHRRYVQKIMFCDKEFRIFSPEIQLQTINLIKYQDYASPSWFSLYDKIALPVLTTFLPYFQSVRTILCLTLISITWNVNCHIKRYFYCILDTFASRMLYYFAIKTYWYPAADETLKICHNFPCFLWFFPDFYGYCLRR